MAITVPSAIGEIQVMESTPYRAMTLANDLCAATVAIKDVQAWAESQGAGEWSGLTREAAAHATTRFAGTLSFAEAALFRAVVATDRFEDRLRRLERRRSRLDARRIEVNELIESLAAEIDAGVGVDAVTVEGWRRRAEALTTRRGKVVTDIGTWEIDDERAETDYIAALQGVDSVEEGEKAAADPGLPDPDALLRQLNRRLDDPVALAAWWRGLGRAQRQALLTEHPHQVGNADGLPVRDRDEANRGALLSDIDYWKERKADGQLTDAQGDQLANALAIRAELDDRRAWVDPATGDHLVNLLVYKPGIHSGDGGVAIALGDPDRAAHVAAFIPGLTNDTQSIGGNIDDLEKLRNAARKTDESVATVLWLDYDAPSGDFSDPGEIADFALVAGTGKAEEGGARFSDFVDGLRASDQGGRAHLTAIGHSYGSTTLGHALQDGAPVDDAILVGSPGQPEATAERLTDANVYVGSKDHDPVSLLGRGSRGGLGALGFDPAQETFGATRFETGDGSFRVQDLLENHTSYFEGDSGENMASIMVGEGAVSEQDHRGTLGGMYLTLDELVTGSTVVSGSEWLHERGEDGAGWVYERGKDGLEFVGGIGDGLLEPFRGIGR